MFLQPLYIIITTCQLRRIGGSHNHHPINVDFHNVKNDSKEFSFANSFGCKCCHLNGQQIKSIFEYFGILLVCCHAIKENLSHRQFGPCQVARGQSIQKVPKETKKILLQCDEVTNYFTPSQLSFSIDNSNSWLYGICGQGIRSLSGIHIIFCL